MFYKLRNPNRRYLGRLSVLNISADANTTDRRQKVYQFHFTQRHEATAAATAAASTASANGTTDQCGFPTSYISVSQCVYQLVTYYLTMSFSNSLLFFEYNSFCNYLYLFIQKFPSSLSPSQIWMDYLGFEG